MSHSKESIPHFMTKLMIMKLLQNKRHKALIEQDIGYGTVDCFDYTTKYAYECEGSITQEKIKSKFKKYSLGGAEEVVLIPYKKLWKILDVDSKKLHEWTKAIEVYLNG